MHVKPFLYLFSGIFALALPIHWALVCLYPRNPICTVTQICRNQCVNFLLFLVASLLGALVIAAVLTVCLSGFRRWRHRPKIGEVLISKGLILEEDLEAALAEQNVPIGRFLVHKGRVTELELGRALAYQRKNKDLKLGEALVALGYANDADIARALQESRKRLGEVFIEKGMLTHAELSEILREMRG